MIGSLAAKHDIRSTQMRFELVKRRLNLPSFMVKRG